MTISVDIIIKRLDELEITPSVRNGELFLKAKKGSITEKCKQVVAENKEAIIAHLTKPVSNEEFASRVARIFPRGCAISFDPPGYTLEQRVSDLELEAKERYSRHEAKGPRITPEEWAKAEQVQYRRVEEYMEKWRSNGRPVPESYMGDDGFMFVTKP